MAYIMISIQLSGKIINLYKYHTKSIFKATCWYMYNSVNHYVYFVIKHKVFKETQKG